MAFHRCSLSPKPSGVLGFRGWGGEGSGVEPLGAFGPVVQEFNPHCTCSAHLTPCGMGGHGCKIFH